MLEKKTVKVKPIKRSSWLGNGHDGAFMYKGTFATFVLPITASTGKFKNILTKEEQKECEYELGLEENALNFNNRKSEFWSNFRVKLSKEERVLNLADVTDFISYKLLLSLEQVAPSWKERDSSPMYKWAIVDTDEEINEEAKGTDKRGKAYRFLGKIDGDPKAMRDLLKVLGKSPASTAKKEFLIVEIEKMINNPKEINSLMEIIDDENYSLKLLVEEAIECGALVKDGMKYRLGSDTGDVLGIGRQEVVDSLKLKKNVPILDRITAQVKLASEKE